MAKRSRSVLRGISRHRSYTYHEVARALNVARGTVARWVKDGLPAITDQKPHLIIGADLIEHRNRAKAAKRRCELAELYCFRCRTPRQPEGGLADVILSGGPAASLRALCGCGCIMNKRIAVRRLQELQAQLSVAIRQAPSRIAECVNPSLNDAIEKDAP